MKKIRLTIWNKYLAPLLSLFCKNVNDSKSKDVALVPTDSVTSKGAIIVKKALSPQQLKKKTLQAGFE